MSSVPIFNQNYLDYDRWFDLNPDVLKAEARLLRTLLPDEGRGIEVGAGTGRFTSELRIPYAVEPSFNMAGLARSRGVQVCQAFGESLPFPSGFFDYAVLVTVLCFVHKPRLVINECRRVVRDRGCLLVGMLDPKSELGALYEAKKNEDVFYRVASFHALDQIQSILREARFELLECAQTVLGIPYQTSGWEGLKTGSGEGAFVGLLARKLEA
ncbi:MAG: class I SAM-dependent methyltransferase [Anaerolineales bacterium]